MLKFLAERIKKGYMTLEDVPEKYREAVRKLLTKEGFEVRHDCFFHEAPQPEPEPEVTE